MQALVEDNLTAVPHNAPIIGDVFTTQAGIHQAGVARQEEAPGGLIYLAYDAGLRSDEARLNGISSAPCPAPRESSRS